MTEANGNRKEVDYIEQKLDRSELYFNQALAYAKGEISPPAGESKTSMIQAGINAGRAQIKLIEDHIQSEKEHAKENANYHSIIG